MQGKQKIIDDILMSAKRSAETMIADAEKERAETDEKIAAALAESEKLAAEEANAAADAVYAGRLKLGELEASKTILRYKRACVDGVYDAVKDRILKMKDGEYLDFLAKLIGDIAEDGDEIIAAKSDSKRVTAAWVKKLSATLKKKLSLSSECGEFEAGIVLRNAEYDRNLTLDEIVSDLKDRTESDTVKSLGL